MSIPKKSKDKVRVGSIVMTNWGEAVVSNLNPKGEMVEEGDFQIKVKDGYGIRNIKQVRVIKY